jgi:hypothetical protein
MMTEKYGVYNPLIGQYVFLENKEDIPAKILETALALYYVQTNNAYLYVAKVDEFGHETSGDATTGLTEIPQEILNEAINNLNETL